MALFSSWASASVVPLHRFSAWGVQVALLIAGVRASVEGREFLEDHRNTLVLANHVSHLDPPLIYLYLGIDLRAVAKKEVFSIPLFGRVLRRAGFVSVDRRDAPTAKDALSAAGASLRAGNCFLVFPEGTRSSTGELLPFKKGAFVAALEAGSRIVPLVVHGTQSLLPRGSWRVRPGRVTVRILDPVDVRGYSYEDRDRLIEEVRGRMAAALTQITGPS